MTININELRTVLARHGTSVLNEDEILELLDRIEAAESDALEQARLNGMGASREAALMAKLEAAENERAIDEQRIADLMAELNRVGQENEELRAKIEAIPYGAIAKTLTEVMDIAAANGADSRSMPDEYVEVAAWLCGIPGAKGE